MVAEESDNLVIFISSTDAIKTGNKIHYYLLITKFIIWSFENIVFLHFRGRFLHSVIGKRIVRFGFPTVTYVVQVIEVSVHMKLE